MILCKPIGQRLTVLFLSLFVISIVNISAQDAAAGKAIFTGKCAACHNVFKKMTGPALMGLEERGKWADHKELLAWINNPAAYMAKDPYTQGLKAEYGSMMTGFADVTQKDVDDMVAYINAEVANKNAAPKPGAVTETADTGNQNAIIFGVISLVLGIIALILMQVNSNLKKMSDDSEGIVRPEPVAFYRNKTYIAMASIVFFVFGGYMVAKGAIGLGRQKDYQPEQPIYYSHKVHAGINQISCLYCHGNAWESKHAAIPSVNVCMNCHKAINTYEKGPKLYKENGDEVNGTAEIAKLYQFAGFDPNNPSKWDPAKAKPIEWTKIHNLPDHVYFNHSQHIRAGNVQCQSCHGEITAMDEVKQVADLSMGWCINCHRQTNVNFNYDSTKGNKFYSIYEKFHNDIKSGKMDSVKVKDIGGLECQKCHY
ncbi:MAG TPA: cytochrome c3 family protein [Chitinophagaceae bacterium]|jgi:cytochrome c2|nr:cytochrome c3 family protein [Chitinophagaceae bacterium]HPH31474.1 cytochrome c3 family protein [Chitinophagaceae bacterium]HPN58233.1 cytochrome c3 family protein [Chitinophagaceae bacterium]HRG23854.1 cytochrome c3 family protein [Chitinophagaceae bacterium]